MKEKKIVIEINNKGREVIDMISELKKENELLELQRKYENGNIKEEELSENQKEELLALYKKQILNLEVNVAHYKKILENYKTKIIDKIKKK